MPYAILSSAIDPNKMGVMMGLFNMFIVIPQIFAALGGVNFLNGLLGDAPIFSMVVAGISMILSSLSNLLITDKNVSKISIVGAGMVSTPGVTYRMFRALSDENINILAISTSEIKLSVIIEENNILKAIKKLHTIFDLD